MHLLAKTPEFVFAEQNAAMIDSDCRGSAS